MVSSPLSVTQVASFSIDGPTPWLFVDLPALGSLFTSVQTAWFVAGVPAAKFAVSPGPQANDRFWLAPSDATWNGAKTVGDWHNDVSRNLVGIQFAENGGIGVGISEGSGSTLVNFAVTPAPVPVPGGRGCWGQRSSCCCAGIELQ